MSATLGRAFLHNFLGQAPAWYKYTIIAFLAVNPLIHLTLGPVVAGWLLLAQFIFTLAMALKCYPLQPGGLLAVEVGIDLAEPPQRCLALGLDESQLTGSLARHDDAKTLDGVLVDRRTAQQLHEGQRRDAWLVCPHRQPSRDPNSQHTDTIRHGFASGPPTTIIARTSIQ